MSSRTIVIRDFAQSDLEAVRTVLLDAYAEYELLLPKERWAQYKLDIENSVTNTKVKSRIVAELNGSIVGSVFLYGSSEEAYGLPELNIHTPIIRLLAVRRSARGYGVATELIRASAARSLQWGSETLHLHTSDAMSSAIRLYERLGFERAVDKDIHKENSVVKSYRLQLKETPLLQA